MWGKKLEKMLEKFAKGSQFVELGKEVGWSRLCNTKSSPRPVMYYNHTKHWQPYDVHISRRLHYRFQHFLIYHTIWSRHHDVAVLHHNPVQPCTASVPAVEADYSTRCTCYNICHNCQCNDRSNPHGTNPSKKQETYPHQTLSASENPYHWQRREHVQCYMVRFRINCFEWILCTWWGQSKYKVAKWHCVFCQPHLLY